MPEGFDNLTGEFRVETYTDEQGRPVYKISSKDTSIEAVETDQGMMVIEKDGRLREATKFEKTFITRQIRNKFFYEEF